MYFSVIMIRRSLYAAFHMPPGKDFIRFSGIPAQNKSIRGGPDHPAAFPAVFRREKHPDRRGAKLPYPGSLSAET